MPKSVSEQVVQFAKAYPDSEYAAELLGQLIRRLLRDGDLSTSRNALEQCQHIRDQKVIEQLTAALDSAATRVATVQANSAQQQRLLASIVRQLGGVREAHVVVYSEQLGASKQRRCDLDIVQTADDVLRLALDCQRRNWKWEILKVFPRGEQGYRDASNFAQKYRSSHMTLIFDGY